MGIDRRKFLTGLSVAAVWPVTGRAMRATPAYIAACKDEQGFAAATLTLDGGLIDRISLAARGHGAAISRSRKTAVIFGRRPGQFALPINLQTGRAGPAFFPPPDRRFNGHGCFSADGRYLYAAENNFEAAIGEIGVYNSEDGWRRVEVYPSYGVGPHEVIMLRGQNRIAVANGGIVTHPDLPRQKLNIPTMQPSLAIIDAGTGALVEQALAPSTHHKVSLRHMAEAVNGDIWIAGQNEGSLDQNLPLISVFRAGQGLEYLPESGAAELRGYIGSIAASQDGAFIAVTSPRGGVMQVWDASNRTRIASHLILDVSGIASLSPTGFLASDGAGKFHSDGVVSHVVQGIQWDNHLTRL